MKRNTRHRLQALGFFAAYYVLRALPLDAASWLGGRMGRLFGPHMKAARYARRNLEFAFPEQTPAEREALLPRMWEHLGRVMGEFAHLPGNGLYSRMSVKGLENAPLVPALYIGAHIGNWELSYALAYEHGIPIGLVYRQANNPYIEPVIVRHRLSHASSVFPKGQRGAARMAKAIRRGESMAILMDQKMNEGIPIPFFGREAMTAPAVAQLALRYHMPIVPAMVVRTKGCHFQATVFPPIEVVRSGDEAADVRAILTAINAMLEGWIRQYPEQWFWVHRRWDKRLY